MKRTPQNLEAHFRRRLRQRFGLEITAEELGKIVERIEAGRAGGPVRLRGDWGKRSLHAVTIGEKGVIVPVVYSQKPKALVTALPQRVLWKYRDKIVRRLARPLPLPPESSASDAPLVRLVEETNRPCYRVEGEHPLCTYKTYVYYRETPDGQRKALYVQSHKSCVNGVELKWRLRHQYRQKYMGWPKNVAWGLADRFHKELMRAIERQGLPWHEAALATRSSEARAA
jgi:hypothetical protein